MAQFKWLICASFSTVRIRGRRLVSFPFQAWYNKHWCRSICCAQPSFQGSLQACPRSPFTLVLPDNLNVEHATFQGLGIKTPLCNALKREGITDPTLIQCEALPFVLQRRNCIIHSETGTGKTLTFLLPAIQDVIPGLSTVILVPTRELAVQMHYQATKLAGGRRNSRRIYALFSGVDKQATMQDYKDINPHILIATPKRMLQLLETNSKDFNNLRRLVLDEVDKILLPLSKHASAKRKVIRETHPRPGHLVVKQLLSLPTNRRLQLICASATANRVLQEELIELGWGAGAELISTTATKLALPNSIEHQYIFNPDQEEMDKLETLVKHFRSSREKSALVFIHRGASISKFVHELTEKGVEATALHAVTLTPGEYPQFLDNFKSGRVQLVVGTEETVRGLDFTWLNTVYLMEVPRNANEYLHLCGRVGRLGSSGRAVVLVSGDQELRRLMLQYRSLQVEGKIDPVQVNP